MAANLLDREHIRVLQQVLLCFTEFAVAALPLGGLADAGRLDCGDLVFGTIRRPIRVIGRDDVRTRFGEMEGRVHDARLDAFGDPGAQHRLARPARNPDPVALDDAAFLRIVRMDLQAILVFFFFNDTAATEIYTLSLHDALPFDDRAHV